MQLDTVKGMEPAAAGVVAPFGVLLVGNFLSKARPGSCTVCELLAARLAAAGWPVVATSDKAARLARLTDMLATVWRRRSDYAVAQVDVYSGPSFVWAEWVCGILRGLGKPFILTLHGGNLPKFASKWPLRVRRLLNSAQVVTTPSRFLQEALCAYRSDLLLLPNPIDLPSYAFRLRSSPQPKLVWLRAFDPIYNPGLAVRSVAVLKARFPTIHLTMFGPDKGKGSLALVKSEIASRGLHSQIEFGGGISKKQVPLALNQADIFINTTNVDNTPVSVVEAMACGLCVVTTNVGGLPYLVDEGQDGLLVAPDDSDAMAAAVGRVLNETDLAARLSSKGRAKAEGFDWTVIMPQWERLLGATANFKDRAQ